MSQIGGKPEPVALVTGGSSGIGLATSARLTRAGYRVYAASRHPAPASAPDHGVFVPLDVGEDASVDACIGEVLASAGRIDVLVNNAGILLLGGGEEVSAEEVRDLFNVNFHGAVRMIRAVLPGMRATGAGRILTVSGIAGLVGTPYMSAYCASKFALEGYCEALDHELRRDGIRLSLIEPGFVNTELGPHGRTPRQPLPHLAGRRARFLSVLQRQSQAGLSAEDVARKIEAVLGQRNPAIRHTVGREAAILGVMRRLLPAHLFERRMRSAFGLDGS